MAATTFSILTSPTNGTLLGFNAATGQCTYTPNNNYTGADSFTYGILCDGIQVDTATVSIQVNPQVATVGIVDGSGGAAHTSVVCGTVHSYKADVSFVPALPTVIPVTYAWVLPVGLTSPDLTLATIPITFANPLTGAKTIQVTVTTPFEVKVKTLVINVSCADAINDTVTTTANVPITFTLSANDVVCN